jgi:serine/threonine-protein kinase
VGAARQLELQSGSDFQARYRVLHRIGGGGMGTVYAVVHVETCRRLALKVMSSKLGSDPDMRARFQQETRITAGVKSEHLVEVFDGGEDKETGALFIVMELLEGKELAEILEERGRLRPDEALVFLRQAARALGPTHAAGIIHRDLKPANLFVTERDDGSPHLKVLDFGIAKLRAQSGQAAKTTRVIGTPLYMAPEQFNGDGAIDHRADLYALGHMAYALIVGEVYWAKEARAFPHKISDCILLGAKEPASVRAQEHGVALPAGFDAWFAKATALAPEDRFDSASELVDDLARVLGVDVGVTVPQTPMAMEQMRAMEEEKERGPEPSPPTLPMELRQTAPQEFQHTLPLPTLPIKSRAASAIPSIGALVAVSALVVLVVIGLVRKPGAQEAVDTGVHDSPTAMPPSLPPPTAEPETAPPEQPAPPESVQTATPAPPPPAKPLSLKLKTTPKPKASAEGGWKAPPGIETKR